MEGGGRPLLWADAKIVDPDCLHGMCLKLGKLVYRGLMDGYMGIIQGQGEF